MSNIHISENKVIVINGIDDNEDIPFCDLSEATKKSLNDFIINLKNDSEILQLDE